MNSSEYADMKIEQLIKERDALQKHVKYLQDSQTQILENFSANAPFGIVIISNYRILHVNPACCDMFGAGPSVSPQDIDILEFIDSQSWDDAAQLLQSTTPDMLEKPMHAILRGRRKDGETFPMSLSVVTISWDNHPAFLCYLQNIDNMTSHEVSKLKSDARRKLRFDAANIFVWSWHRAHATFRVDESLWRMLGLEHTANPRSALRTVLGKVERSDRSRLRRQIFQGIREDRIDTAVFTFHDQDHASRMATIHGHCTDTDHGSLVMVGVVRAVGNEMSEMHNTLSMPNNDPVAEAAHALIVIDQELTAHLQQMLGLLYQVEQSELADDFQEHLTKSIVSGKNLRQAITEILGKTTPGAIQSHQEAIPDLAAPPEATSYESNNPGQHAHTSARILLAEDNLVNQVLAETALRQIGYEVRLVQNGLEALKALEEEEFDCILMDIQMPEMSGIEATQRIRASKTAYSRIPIIALTSLALPEDRERIQASGITDYLPKPVSVEELKTLVERAIASFRAQAGT